MSGPGEISGGGCGLPSPTNRKGPTVLVEMEIIIGRRYVVLVDAETVDAAQDVAGCWDPDGTIPAGFVAIGESEHDRAVTGCYVYEDGTPAEWAADNGGETVTGGR